MMLALLAACSGGSGEDGDGPSPTDTIPDTDTDTTPTGSTSDTVPVPEPTTPSTGPVVVLAIGDGMGFEHVRAGSLYATGQTDGLRMQGLPVAATVRTSSFDGITDSAAGGTALACGVHTHNDVIGQDRDGVDVENLVELARTLGWATGVVTTSELPHATPAVFTAHHPNRDQETQIAALQVDSAADVMLGGGTNFYVDLHKEIAAAGYTWVETSAELAATKGLRVWGAFSPAHLPYVADGPPDPGLSDLVADALARLQPDPEGMFLMIEGARIDHASHGNQPELMVPEVQAFDDAIGAVLDWRDATGRDLFLVVTADHECGGLDLISTTGSVGVVPDARWRWGSHTNEDVPLFAEGTGTAVFDGQVIDQREIHNRIVEHMTGTYTAAEAELLPDGRHDDLPFRAVTQAPTPSSLGDDTGRIEALVLGADSRGLAIGVEGVFPWQGQALVLLIDTDFGTGTGVSSMIGATSGATSPAEAVIDALRLGAGPPGFGTDLVLVSIGGAETPYVGMQRGLFGLRAPWGETFDVGPVRAAFNYGPDTRTRPTEPHPVTPGVGFDALIEWDDLFPGGLPAGIEVAVVAALVSSDGTSTTNQLLPPFPPGTPAPGTLPVPALPGVVVFPIDPDGDGIPNPAAPYTFP